MTQCPDCDSRLIGAEAEGSGKCAACHGTGWKGLLASVVEVIGGEQAECEQCQGSGTCQTSLGAGVLEETEIGAAA